MLDPDSKEHNTSFLFTRKLAPHCRDIVIITQLDLIKAGTNGHIIKEHLVLETAIILV